MQTNPRLNIRAVTWSNPVGADLRRAQQAELDARFGTPDHEPGVPPSGADCAVFLVAYDKGSGQPVGAAGSGSWTMPPRKSSGSTCCPTPGARVWPAPSWRPSRPRHTSRESPPVKAEAGSAQPDGRHSTRTRASNPCPNFGAYVGVEHSYCYAKPIDSHSAAHTAMA